MDIAKIQILLQEAELDGWLFTDFQGHDFITKEFLSIDFIENLLKQLDLRENLNQSNWRAERFSI